MIHEVSGDILFTKAQAIAHGISPNDSFDQGLARALRPLKRRQSLKLRAGYVRIGADVEIALAAVFKRRQSRMFAEDSG